MDSDSILSEWVMLATALGINALKCGGAIGNDRLIQEVYDVLAHYNYLLIFDSVDSAEAIRPYIPPSSWSSAQGTKKHHVIITSCSIGGWIEPKIDVEGFTEGDSVEYIRQRLGAKECSDEELAQMHSLHLISGGLPLCLSLCMSCVCGQSVPTSGITRSYALGMMLSTLKSKGLNTEVLTENPESTSLNTTKDSLAGFVSLIVESLTSHNSTALNLLGFISLVGSSHLPHSLLVSLCRGICEDPHRALRPLIDGYILREENKPCTRYYIHSHLQEYMCDIIVGVDRTSLEPIFLPCKSRMKLLKEWLSPLVRALDGEFTAADRAVGPLCRLSPHIESVMVTLGRIEESTSSGSRDMSATLLKITLYIRLGESYMAQGRHTEALLCFKKRLTLLDSMKSSLTADTSSYDTDIANTLSAIGGVYAAQDKLSDALNMYKEALQIFCVLSACDREGVDVARTLKSIGALRLKQGATVDALSSYKRALEIERTIYTSCDKKQLILSKTLYSVGDLYKNQGNFNEAILCYRESLDIQKKLNEIGLHSKDDIAKALNNMGNIYYRMGSHEEALCFYVEALELSKELYESGHEEVARILYNIGNVQFYLKNLDDSLIAFQEALQVSRTIGSSDCVDTGKILNNIGNVHMTQENFDAAVAAYLQSWNIKRQNYREYHPDLAKTLGNLASAYTNLGNYSEALKVLNECLALKRAVFDETHMEIVSTKDFIEVVAGLEEYRNSTLKRFRKYVVDRASRRKSGIGFSKQEKLDAAKFVIKYVENPAFRRLDDICSTPEYEQYSACLNHGSLGDIFRSCFSKGSQVNVDK